MKLFAIEQQYPIGPPEHVGQTDYLVMAETKEQALDLIGYNRTKDAGWEPKVAELATDTPRILTQNTL